MKRGPESTYWHNETLLKSVAEMESTPKIVKMGYMIQLSGKSKGPGKECKACYFTFHPQQDIYAYVLSEESLSCTQKNNTRDPSCLQQNVA